MQYAEIIQAIAIVLMSILVLFIGLLVYSVNKVSKLVCQEIETQIETDYYFSGHKVRCEDDGYPD